MSEHVKVENGKYTFFVLEGDYRVHVLRYDEPWLVLETGSKAIWSLVSELIEARIALEAVVKERHFDGCHAPYNMTVNEERCDCAMKLVRAALAKVRP